MKGSLFLITMVLVSFQGFSQCVADAGNDQHWCPGEDTLTLGGSLPANSGTPPYTYQWSIDSVHLTNSIAYYASDFLDDTTKAHPQLVSGFVAFEWKPELPFYLKVTDSTGVSCIDTVIISASLFVEHVGFYTVHIWAGDSVQLPRPNVSPVKWPLDSVLWRPNHGLIDSNAIYPWVKPTRDMVYYSTVWDSKGCRIQGTPFQYVYVHHIGLTEFADKDIKVYPTILNNERDKLTVEGNPGLAGYNFQLINMQGSKVFESILSSKRQTLSFQQLPKGVYLYAISSGSKNLRRGKILIH